MEEVGRECNYCTVPASCSCEVELVNSSVLRVYISFVFTTHHDLVRYCTFLDLQNYKDNITNESQVTEDMSQDADSFL